MKHCSSLLCEVSTPPARTCQRPRLPDTDAPPSSGYLCMGMCAARLLAPGEEATDSLGLRRRRVRRLAEAPDTRPGEPGVEVLLAGLGLGLAQLRERVGEWQVERRESSRICRAPLGDSDGRCHRAATKRIPASQITALDLPAHLHDSSLARLQRSPFRRPTRRQDSPLSPRRGRGTTLAARPPGLGRAAHRTRPTSRWHSRACTAVSSSLYTRRLAEAGAQLTTPPPVRRKRFLAPECDLRSWATLVVEKARGAPMRANNGLASVESMVDRYLSCSMCRSPKRKAEVGDGREQIGGGGTSAHCAHSISCHCPLPHSLVSFTCVNPSTTSNQLSYRTCCSIS
jgi:hypothetical protein